MSLQAYGWYLLTQSRWYLNPADLDKLDSESWLAQRCFTFLFYFYLRAIAFVISEVVTLYVRSIDGHVRVSS